jgi:hypothetical protein
MKRLFYLTKTIESVEEISKDLHERGITDWRFHVWSQDEAGLYTHKLHTASVLDKTDLARLVERGLMIGAVVGLAIVVPLALFSGLDWPIMAWIAMFAFAVLAGGWVGGFGGITGENYRLRRFHDAVQAGKHLIMVDVHKKDVPTMKELMIENHPEAILQGESSSINNPFSGKDGKSHVA